MRNVYSQTPHTPRRIEMPSYSKIWSQNGIWVMSVRTRAQFVHSRATRNPCTLEPAGSADVALLGVGPAPRLHPQYPPATGPCSPEARTLGCSWALLDESSPGLAVSLPCRHRCSEAAGGDLAGAVREPAGCLLSL